MGQPWNDHCLMKRSRGILKNAPRFCLKIEEAMKADALANELNENYFVALDNTSKYPNEIHFC